MKSIHIGEKAEVDTLIYDSRLEKLQFASAD